MSTARFCRLFDIPERTWRRKQARAGTPGFSSGAVASAGAGPVPARGGRAGWEVSGVGSSLDLGAGPP
jgi:hypothetical protein